jgi:hypothetical protein
VFTRFEDERLVHFTTVGRRSGERHTKWWLPFAPDGDVLYLLEENGTAAHWVQNILANPDVELEGRAVTARVVEDPTEQARARHVCGTRFARVGLAVADLVERGLVVAFEARA